jgi:hypothetical protein
MIKMFLLLKNSKFKIRLSCKILYIRYAKCYLSNNKLFLVCSIFTKVIIFSKVNLARYNLWGIKKNKIKKLFDHSMNFKLKYKK